jgi:hypothetical protein
LADRTPPIVHRVSASAVKPALSQPKTKGRPYERLC